MSAPRWTPGTVLRQHPCGCTVDGIGNLQDPWRVKRCAAHEEGPKLLRENAILLHALETAYVLHRKNECPTDTTQRDENWQDHKGVECTCTAYDVVRAAIKAARGGQ